DTHQIDRLIAAIHQKGKTPEKSERAPLRKALLITLISSISVIARGQPVNGDSTGTLLGETGIIITIVLLLIPILVGFFIMVGKASRVLKQYKQKIDLKEANALADYLRDADGDQAERELLERKQALDYRLTNTELSGAEVATDRMGVVN